MTYTHFKIEEFRCRHCGENHMDPDFVRRLDIARGYAGVPFIVTSGYRCPEHDKAVGGAGNHPTGKAADIRCRSDGDRFLILEALHRVGFTRFGIGKTFIHVDACDEDGRPGIRIWLYA